MTDTRTLASFPEHGFAIMEDDEGKFLMFKEQQELIPIHDKAFEVPKHLVPAAILSRVSNVRTYAAM